MKKLLNSKWTAINPQNKEKHFLIVQVHLSSHDNQVVEKVTIEAVFTKRRFELCSKELQDDSKWSVGWRD